MHIEWVDGIRSAVQNSNYAIPHFFIFVQCFDIRTMPGARQETYSVATKKKQRSVLFSSFFSLNCTSSVGGRLVAVLSPGEISYLTVRVLFTWRWSYVSYDRIKTKFPHVGASRTRTENHADRKWKTNLRDYCCCAVLPLSQFRWTFFVHFSWQMYYWLPQYRCRCPILCSACVARIWLEPTTTLAATAAAAGTWIVSFDHRHQFYHSNSTGIDLGWLWCIGVPCM